MSKAFRLQRQLGCVGQVQAKFTRMIMEYFPYGNLYAAGSRTSNMGVAMVGYRFTQLPTTIRWRKISVGLFHTLAIDEHNHLWSWGINDNGQLGFGDTVTRTTPTLLDSSRKWSRVAASKRGFFSLFLDSSGNIFTAGKILPYQSTLLRQIDGYTFSEIAAGETHAAAISPSGWLYTWGINYGALGNGSSSGDVSYPTRIGGPNMVPSIYSTEILGVQKISAGVRNTFYIDIDHNLYGTGYNTYGETGAQTKKFTLRRTNMIDAKLGRYHSLGIDINGHLLGRGFDYYGILPGAPLDSQQNNPWYTMSTKKTTQISAGEGHSFAILDDDPYICGVNGQGQCGLGYTSTTVDPLTRVESVYKTASGIAPARRVIDISSGSMDNLFIME